MAIRRPSSLPARQVVRGFVVLILLLGAPVPARSEEPFVCGVEAGAAAAPTPDDWTLGRKKVLYIRVRFADQAREPESKQDAKRKMAEVNRFLLANSYRAVSLKTTITRTYVVPRTSAEYAALGLTPLRDDALAAALAHGKNFSHYDLDVIQYAGGPGDFGGTATIGGRGCWLKSTTAGVAIHELGHNLGLHHANAWVTTDGSVIGPGTHLEYGDVFDTMGPAIGDLWHFNARSKALLRWLSASDLVRVTTSGTYRVFAHDARASAGRVRTLTITRDASFDYWIELRQLFTGNVFSMNGAGLRRARFVNDAVGTQLLDTAPSDPGERFDAPLVIGRTFSDTEAGIHVTPIGKGGTTPESLDVVVNLGTFPENEPPTVAITASTTETEVQAEVAFQAAAVDPDGDPLAYQWEFGPGLLGPNAASVTTRWLAEGEYLVRCTVTDMKGGTASDSLVVSVGPSGAVSRRR